MPVVEPFRALRFDPACAGEVSRVTAPPYDVYGEAERDEMLAERHSVVHLDSPPGGPSERYEYAAATLAAWLGEGVLQLDAVPSIYAYEQAWQAGGEAFVRRSVIARVRLEELGRGGIHPHERTFSGPKEDRFRLTVSTRCSLSQPLAFYIDPEAQATAPLVPVFENSPDAVAVGRDGVTSRLWAVSDPATVGPVCAALAAQDLFIADGHHRYETAVRYLRHLESEGPLAQDHPARYVAMVLVGSGDPGLRVMPTHRVLSGLRGFDPERLAAEASEAFEWRRLPQVDPADAGALAAAVAEAPQPSVGVLTRGGFGILVPRAGEVPAELVQRAEPLRRLNVTVLDDWLIPTWLHPAFGDSHRAYVHCIDEAQAALAGGADVAFLLEACGVKTVIDIAACGELMPQKSTYFYPKVLTGLVLYPLA